MNGLRPRRQALFRVAVTAAVVGSLVLAVGADAGSAGCASRVAFVTGAAQAMHLASLDGSADDVIDIGPSTIVNGARLDGPSWSPDGRQVAYSLSHYAVYAYDHTDIKIYSLGRTSPLSVLHLPLVGSIFSVRWAPDGRRLAFVLFTPNYPVLAATWGVPFGSNFSIFVVNRDGSGLMPVGLTGHATTDLDPTWSPDGKSLAFSSDRSGFGIYVASVDSVQPARRVSPLDVLAVRPSWSPRGGRLAFLGQDVHADSLPWSAVATLGPPATLYLSRPDGTGLRRVGRASGGDLPAWSPDGRQIAYSAPPDEGEGIRTVGVEGGRPHLLNHAASFSPVWTSDGRRIVFVRRTDHGETLWVMRGNGSHQREINTVNFAGPPAVPACTRR